MVYNAVLYFNFLPGATVLEQQTHVQITIIMIPLYPERCKAGCNLGESVQ